MYRATCAIELHGKSILKKKTAICLSGYAFRRALISHSEILESDREHIFRKYRRKNNKKVSLTTGKRQKTVRYRGICLRTFLWYGRVLN